MPEDIYFFVADSPPIALALPNDERSGQFLSSDAMIK
jgi:hypothetical protein